MSRIVSVFSTGIFSNKEKEEIIKDLTAHDQVICVHIDLEDEDKIMRVESEGNCVNLIMDYMLSNALTCKELDSFDFHYTQAV